MHDEPEIASGLHTERRAQHHAAVVPGRADAQPAAAPDAPARRAHAGATRRPARPGSTARAVARRLGDEFDEQFFIGRRPDGTFVERVAGEEQHHSSWLFGEPETPVLRAYKGDPARIRLVHGGVKETHVFHLHVHQWRAVPQDTAEPSVWGLDGERRAEAQGLAAARLDHHRPADRLRHRPALRLRQPPARGRRHHLALPPLSPLPPRHVGAVAQLRPPGRRHAGPTRTARPASRWWSCPGARRSRWNRASRASRGSSTACTRRSRRPRPRCSTSTWAAGAGCWRWACTRQLERDAFDPAVVADPQPGRPVRRPGRAEPPREREGRADGPAPGDPLRRRGARRRRRVQPAGLARRGGPLLPAAAGAGPGGRRHGRGRSTTHPEVVVEHGRTRRPCRSSRGPTTATSSS